MDAVALTIAIQATKNAVYKSLLMLLKGRGLLLEHTCMETV
jgi:hypothetical protein